MKHFKHLREGNRKYLLMPTMPTPNGGLHLGHISGPYLKMDVMARAQRRNGSQAAIMFGSDVYESYTTLKAWQTGQSVEDVCMEYHRRIINDLQALNICYDEYINPLDEQYETRYNTFIRRVVQALVDKEVTEVLPEKYLYSPAEDTYLAGCWILGKCPVCKAGTGSYQCENCGTHYRPQDIIDPVFRKGNSKLEEIVDLACYLKIRKKEELIAHLEKMGIQETFLDIAKTYCAAQGDRIRLTNPDKWGTPWTIEGSNVPHVIFTYTALYFFSLFCGELYQEKFGLPWNAFHPDSPVITIASFGIDCSVPYMIGALGCGIESGLYRPMDYLLPNHFFKLENEKFSTSRGHAIWAGDIVHQTPASADAVRYFLVWHNPEYEMRDFKVNDFILFANTQLADELQGILQQNWSLLNGQYNSHPPADITEMLEQLLIEQERCLRPPDFRFKDACLSLHAFIDCNSKLAPTADNAYWWLRGFALIAYPIMPDCALSLWQLLGNSEELQEKYFFTPTVPDTSAALPVYFSPVSYETILPALPATLSNKYPQAIDL